MDKTELAKFGEVRVTGHYTIVYDKSLKKALIMKRSVHLEDADKDYGTLKIRKFTTDEIKKRHMGKIKCIVKYSSDDELKRILEIYFS